MREIKFKRVFKNRTTGEISYMMWGNIDFRNQPVFDFSSFASPGTNSHSGPIADCQYTGLKDKNGVEIYEGDVIDIPLYGNCIIVWNENICSFQYAYFANGKGEAVGGRMTNTLYDHQTNKYEIIGDIYSSPELLKN